MMPGAGQSQERGAVPSRLTEVTGFGSNPGNLRMFEYVPKKPRKSLVVVLHGCTQTAASYDLGAGWSTLADRYGFMLLCPEQRAENNPKTCFNWFRESDIVRGGGEAASIREMISRMASDHDVDPRRVFITGLSAGGAMTAVMLATYPEVFAGGAIIAGLPYRSATSMRQALESMFSVKVRTPHEWGDLVRAASPHRGPWPRVSVWHGGADTVVKPRNAEELLKQWTDVHGLSTQPDRTETVDGYPRHVWSNAAGEDVIESYTIPLMAHGAPVASGDGDTSYGVPGEYLIEVGISSSYHIARFWGLTDSRRTPWPMRPDAGTADTSAASTTASKAAPKADDAPPRPSRLPERVEVIEPGPDDILPPKSGRRGAEQQHGAGGHGWSADRDGEKERQAGVSRFVEDTIKRALEAAGLMKRR
ncbi:extracellular catalytic domain type 1 short-chain-length polyhydroxyalkanoate depolymerase [Rhodoplanes roseus]|uniref:Esterase n=1 Tax=Rhodoplanes roseus TaxID=29409 RepID=A0A327KPZ1_9BRAD|nr:PHB depolymerase family esterase [Rhodoplanes roseus]RAI40044.1 esterase [Rhodoplanes roseus]